MTPLKPMLCETCLEGEKEIRYEVIGYYKKGITRLYYFCKKKGRYVTDREKYYCSYFVNKRLTEYVK